MTEDQKARIKELAHAFCDAHPELFTPRIPAKQDQAEVGVVERVKVEKFDHTVDPPQHIETVEVDYIAGTVHKTYPQKPIFEEIRLSHPEMKEDIVLHKEVKGDA